MKMTRAAWLAHPRRTLFLGKPAIRVPVPESAVVLEAHTAYEPVELVEEA